MKAAREMIPYIKGLPQKKKKRTSSIRSTVDISSETIEDRGQWDNIFEWLKEKNIN